jgi:hypothetical protein
MMEQNQEETKKPTRSTRRLIAVYRKSILRRSAQPVADGQARFDFEVIEQEDKETEE